MPNSKTCVRCSQLLSLENFGKNRSRKDGLTTYCKPCISEVKKVFYQTNRSKLLARGAAYRNANSHKLESYHREYYRKNAELCKYRIKKWQAANKEKLIAYNSKRRLLVKSNLFFVSSKELSRLLEEKCAYCKEAKSDSIDHIIPVSRGGSHSIGNLIGSCTPCNSKKRDKTIMEFRLWKCNQIVTKIS